MNEMDFAKGAAANLRGSEPISPARWVLAGLSLSMLLSSLGTSIANVGLPAMAQAFDASFQQVQWIVLAYLLAMTTLVVSVGRLGDLVGRKRLLLAGIALFTTASALCGAATTLWLLITARATQGLGAAVIMALSMAFVGDLVPKNKVGSAMGLLGTMSAVGTALGPTLGGLLIAGLGWQALFYINVPLGIVVWVLVRRELPSDRPRSTIDRKGFDHLGTLLLALTLAAFALAITSGRGSFGYLNAILLIATAAGAGLFVLVQSNAASPLVQLKIFRTPELGARFAMNILVTTVVMATLVVGPFYLSGALALDAARVGLIMSSGPIVAALLGVPSGGLVDRFGAHRMSIAGIIGMTTGCALLAILPSGFGVSGYIGGLAIITAGYAFFQTANNTAVMTGIEPHQRGLVSGLLSLSRNLGLITGASFMGAVFAWAQARSSASTASKAVEAGLQTTFALAALLVAVALVFALRLRSS